MGLSSKEVSSVGIGSDRFLPAPSSSMKRQSSSSSSPSPTPSSSASQQQKVQQSEPLKCPRCDSTNTKFCYYNNYNKSQPRHFCKTCKRHWTKGGTLRNVPVGGGRKNKRKMSNTGIKATSKTTTTIGAATAALITGMSNTTMTTIQPQQPRLNIPQGTLGGVDEKNLSEAFYQTLGRHPPCSMPDSSIAFSHKSINEGNNGIFLGSTRSLPHNEQQFLNFPFSNLGGNFESNPCSVSSIQCSNLYNYTGDQASNSLEETIMNSLNTNLNSSSMRMGDHQHQQSWSMATNTSTVMSMTSNWGWDDLEKYVSVDESELTIPWDDADIKP